MATAKQIMEMLGLKPHPTQLFIPGGTYHISRFREGSSFALLGTTEWPGVEPSDVEMGDREKLMADYPALRDEINDFTR